MRKIVVVIVSISIILFVGAFDVRAEDARVFHKSDNSAKRIALTFDDGPHPRLTPMILEILEEYDIDATFFVIGQNVVDYPDTMKKLAESGCEIGNHTFSHRDLLGRSEIGIKEEIMDCSNALYENYGVIPTLIRPPRGKYDDGLIKVSRALDYDIILWSIDTKDWAHASASDIAQKVLGSVKGGDIILMHDFIGRESHTCEALRLIIPELLERGYEFVSVSELIREEI